MSMITRSEVLQNRRKWIDFLKSKDRKKERGLLDAGKGHRCCLGHGCFILGIGRRKSKRGFSYETEDSFPPDSFIERVGLYTNEGIFLNHGLEEPLCVEEGKMIDSLTDLNDNTKWKPWQIGELLEGMIEGGKHSPFKPLTDYPE